MRACLTPTSPYCAASRCAGSGSHVAETMPTEVESPMCATEVHEVRSGRGPAAVRACATARGAWLPDPAASPGLADLPGLAGLAGLAGAAGCSTRVPVCAAACARAVNTPATAALTSDATSTATRPA